MFGVALRPPALLALLALLALGPPAAAAPWSAPEAVGEWPLVPAPPPVVTGFDPPADPWGAGHRGVDLLGHVGQSVRAALPGRVSFAGRIAGRGVVVVDHGDTRTTYEPVTTRLALGTSVGAGEVIGSLDLVGSHCFPRACLHWGWLRGETYLDPLSLVGAGPVRLLPLWRADPVGGSTALRPTAPPPRPPTHPVHPYADWRPWVALTFR